MCSTAAIDYCDDGQQETVSISNLYLMSPIPTDIYTLCPFPLDFPSTTQFTIFDNFYLCPSLDPASTSSSCPVSLLTLLKKVFIFFQPQIFLSLKKKPLRSFLQISEPICGRLQISCQRNILENKSNLSKPFLILLAKEQLVTM